MKRAGLFFVAGMLALAIAAPAVANEHGPVASPAKSKKHKKCKKKHGGKKKQQKKCKKKKKKKKKKKSPVSYPSPLVISPASWDFGNFPIGLAGGSQQFTITNPTADTVGPVSTALSGANPGAFTKSGDLCYGQSLGPGSYCYLYVGCVGSGSAPATFNATLLIGNPGGSREAALTCRQF
jgi:hypothetical protein